MCYECWNKSFPPELQDSDESLWAWIVNLLRRKRRGTTK